MFQSARAFNKPLSDWNVSRVTNMCNVFHHASAFNQDLSQWDVSQVTNMKWMFVKVPSFQWNTIQAWHVSPTAELAGFVDGSSWTAGTDQLCGCDRAHTCAAQTPGDDSADDSATAAWRTSSCGLGLQFRFRSGGVVLYCLTSMAAA